MIKNDAINAIKGMGHNIIEYKSSFDKYDYDEKNISLLKKTIGTNNIDIIFSFNYFPDVSRVANEKGISYVSWVYDNPHLTLNSETIFNEINIVFVFDTSQVEKYRKLGVKNIFYSPLPSKSVNISPITYKHDISFVGTLYDGEKDQFGQIKNLPDNLRGRIDGIITAQHNLYGADIIDETINTFYDEIKKNVKTSLGEHYRECDRDIFADIVRRRVTMYDRKSVLKLLGEKFKTDLYCEIKHPELPVNYMGIVSNDKLPVVMAESKINLNISLRSIRTGIPLRVMQILGAGGFCMTDYKKDMDEYFEDGINMAYYYCEEDLLEKCDFYLNNEDARKKVTINGKITAENRLGYEVLLNKIFEKVIRNA